MGLCRVDVHGYRLQEGLKVLKENTSADIVMVDTFSPKQRDISSGEARIIRVLESDKNIELTVGYF